MKKYTRIFCILLVATAALALLFACSTGTGGGDDPVNTPTPYEITVTPIDAAGSEVVTANVTEAVAGTTITLTATLGVGRRVALSADGVVITPSTISANGDAATFTMPGNTVSITAIYSDIPPTLYPITITPIGATGSEEVTASVSEATEGTTITLTANLGSSRNVTLSAAGATIVPSDISADGDTATFTMPGSAVSITATFKTVYPLTITPIGAIGSEAVTASVTEASEGTLITLTATLGTNRHVTFSAIDSGITPVTISINNGTQTLLMPDSALEVRVCFFSALTHSANSIEYNMHFVSSGGPFTMGEYFYPTTKQVTLTKDFWMSETEVTQSLWEAVWGSSWPGTPPSNFYGAGINHPAYNVSWYDAVAFTNLLTVADNSILESEQVYYSDVGLSNPYTKENAADYDTVYVNWAKKGYRLPTEAEWEYAARYIDGTSWTHGNHLSGDIDYACYYPNNCSHAFYNDFHIDEYAWWYHNNGPAGSYTYGVKQVGKKIANALGLRDMSGNVFEWCHDLYGPYAGGSETDPTGPESGSYQVVRGGDCYMQEEYLCCSYRDYYVSPENGNYNIGFRLCRTAD